MASMDTGGAAVWDPRHGGHWLHQHQPARDPDERAGHPAQPRAVATGLRAA